MQKDTFRPRKDPRPRMEEALDKAIELSVGKKHYMITDGRLVYEEHRRYRYAYTLAWSWDLLDGTDLQLQSTDFDGLPVELSNTKEETVTIVTTQRLPDSTLARAQLVVDRAYLLRKLKEALDPLTPSVPPAQLGLKLFGHLDCPDVTASPRLVDEIRDIFPADEAQHLALQRALGSEVLMILGPPGTGKTDVLAAIALLHAMLYKHRILICSHTNIAIDNAIIRLVGFMRQRGLEYWLDDHLVVRYGNPHLATLETDDYRTVSMPLIVADSIEYQREEIARLERRRDQVIGQLATDKAELPKEVRAWEQRNVEIPRERQRANADLRDLKEEEQQTLAPIRQQCVALQEQAQQAEHTRDQALADWQADEATRQPLAHDYHDQKQKRETATKQLKTLATYKPLKRFWAQLVTNAWQRDLETEREDLTTALETLEKQIVPLQQRQATTQATYWEAEQRCKDLEALIASWTQKRDEQVTFFQEEKEAVLQEIKDLDQELQAGNPRIAQLEQAIMEGRQGRALLEDVLARLDQQMIDAKREAARKVVEAAQIVGATLTGLSMNPVLLNQEWDVVIIDEGSMAPPPAVFVAANRARAHAIVVGDPQQLAPVCKLNDPLVKLWLGRDVFWHGNYTLEQADVAEHHCVLLPYQGRMDSAICDLIREPVYKGRLKDRSPQKVRPTIGPEPGHPVVLYDSSGAERARAEQPASRSSRLNRYHAEVSVHLAQLVLESMPQESRKQECIGIVTPYAAHREVLKDLVRGTELETFARVGTVHAFQGLEFDAVIFDLVESPGLAIAPFLKGGWGSEAMRLMNVAVTRARHKLLIVANMEYIRAEPQHFLLRQVTELAYQKRYVPTEQLRIVPR